MTAPVLRPGSPEEAGLDPARVARMVPAAEERLGTGPSAAYPGFVLLAARGGVVVEHAARGWALAYEERAGRVAELPAGRAVAMRTDTLFDLASLTKVVTALVVVCLAERGALALDAPVSRYLGAGLAPSVTVRALLTHTSGLPPEIDLGPYPDNAARLAAIAAQPLTPGGTPVYSDLGLILAGAAAEAASGRTLPALVHDLVAGPLRLDTLGFAPPPERRGRAAATEYQPWTGRGVLRGEVHDENAHHLGGVAGHAGLFGTAAEVAALGQLMLNGGAYGGARVLGERWARKMLADAGGGRGLGWELNAPRWMGDLASPTAFGHTGYTGTSLVADPATGVLLVLLTNRVHPSRDRGADGAYRRAPARELAAAVRPSP
ncbi:serine hydrolase [Streptomyces sp. DSM 44917]|uniref:Serine hydrolase n=1 Tax=Streptomyces boetiae TaxID=3075541 RepID=A0ABU2LDH2_9ACTN|nr:serine hydrolase [Streptomyces sp. DSM 44917]MDT0309634.1 serine hydrolase [Streptomyces sp. DSM 44917]